MATQSSILACKIPWTEEPEGYSPWCHKELNTTERLALSLFPFQAESGRAPGILAPWTAHSG